MDEALKLLLSIVGTVIALLLTYIAAIVTNTYKRQIDQGQSIALLQQSSQNANVRIEELFTWRLQVQQQEVEKYKEELHRLQNKEQ